MTTTATQGINIVAVTSISWNELQPITFPILSCCRNYRPSPIGLCSNIVTIPSMHRSSRITATGHATWFHHFKTISLPTTIETTNYTKVRYGTRNSPSIVYILWQITPVRTISSYVRLILILSTHPRLCVPSCIFQNKHNISIPISSQSCYGLCPSHPLWIDHSTYTWRMSIPNSVAISPQANYTDWATATCRWNLVPTFVDRGVSRGQGDTSPTVVNLSFLDRGQWALMFAKFKVKRGTTCGMQIHAEVFYFDPLAL
jgi:hypothetical protein